MPRYKKMFTPAAPMTRSHGLGDALPGRTRLTEMTGFGSNPGALRGFTYLPGSSVDHASLVVVLHGCTQDAAGYDHGAGWSALAEQAGFALLFPEQQTVNNPNRCFNWFKPNDTGRGFGEVESIRQMVAHLLNRGLDAERVFITGLSAGGAMTMALLASYPDLFAGGAVIAGLPFGTATSMPQAFQRMRGQEERGSDALARLVRDATSHAGPWPTLSVWHGDADATVAPSNAKLIVEQWRALHGLPQAPTRTEQVDGQSRRVWTGPDGREVIEEITVAGMGHGTPLSTAGEDGSGARGPYMLEAGISSTRHIARFWGLLDQSGETPAQPEIIQPHVAVAPSPRPMTNAKAAPKSKDYNPDFVQCTIANALKAAGLMR